jgi:hypothetical protein
MFFSFRFFTILLSSVAVFAVVGCDRQSPWPGAGQGSAAQLPSAASASASIEPVQNAPIQDRVIPAADPAIHQRLDRIEQDLDGVEANVSGLESDVAGLQTEMTAARPRLEKIESMERHFRQLSLEMDRISKTYHVGPAAPAAQKPVELAPQKKAPAKIAPVKKQASVPLKVQNVRVGEQAGGKTRIVFDTTAPAKINYDIDNSEKILVIELPHAGWSARQDQIFKNLPLISSYKASSDSSGSRLIVQLKDEAQVVTASRIGPDKDNGHRVFLDIAKK